MNQDMMPAGDRKQWSLAEAEDLYYDLSEVYSSPYADDNETRSKAIVFLHRQLNESNNPPTREQMLEKIDEIKNVTETRYLGKFSNQILDRYWRKEFAEMIDPKFYPEYDGN